MKAKMQKRTKTGKSPMIPMSKKKYARQATLRTNTGLPKGGGRAVAPPASG